MGDESGGSIGLKVQATSANGALEDEGDEFVGPELSNLGDEHRLRCVVESEILSKRGKVFNNLSSAGEVRCVDLELLQGVLGMVCELVSPYRSAGVGRLPFALDVVLLDIRFNGL